MKEGWEPILKPTTNDMNDEDESTHCIKGVRIWEWLYEKFLCCYGKGDFLHSTYPGLI
jgi:hypothetical protein